MQTKWETWRKVKHGMRFQAIARYAKTHSNIGQCNPFSDLPFCADIGQTEESERLPESAISEHTASATICRLPQADILQRVTTKAPDRKRVKSTMPLSPSAYGLARLPEVESTITVLTIGNERHNVDDSYIQAIGFCSVVALIRKFPRAWRETMSIAFIARKLKPNLKLNSFVSYVSKRYLVERSGASIRHGRIVRIAKTNEELTILAKLVVTKNEAKAKQLRFETTIDGTRGAVWQEIRAILGDSFFDVLKDNPIETAITLSGMSRATCHRKLAAVRARIIKP